MDAYALTLRFRDTHHAQRYAGFRKDDGLPVMVRFLKSYRPCLVSPCATCDELRRNGCRRAHTPREVCLLRRCATVCGVETILDVCHDGTRWAIVTDKQSPTDELGFQALHRYAGSGFPLDVGLDIFRQVVGIVCDLRDVGVVHGDMNGSNILLKTPPREKARVVLVNFGFAHAVTHDTIKYRASDPTYMPPEVYETLGGECHWESKTVWELGHVLYETLHGTRVRWTLGNVTPALKADLPDSVRHLLQSCLERNERRRTKLSELQSLCLSKDEF